MARTGLEGGQPRGQQVMGQGQPAPKMQNQQVADPARQEEAQEKPQPHSQSHPETVVHMHAHTNTSSPMYLCAHSQTCAQAQLGIPQEHPTIPGAPAFLLGCSEPRQVLGKVEAHSSSASPLTTFMSPAQEDRTQSSSTPIPPSPAPDLPPSAWEHSQAP